MLSVQFMTSASIVAAKSACPTRTPKLAGSKKANVIWRKTCSKRLLGIASVSEKKKADLSADLFRSSQVKRGRFTLCGLKVTLNGMCNKGKNVELSCTSPQSKWLVGALFALAIPWKRDAMTVWVVIGTFVNSLVSASLKKILDQERPSALRSDPGMPSSHAQSIFYAVACSICSVMDWMGFDVISVCFGLVIFICGAYLSWLRVSLQFHTTNQVVVGAALGSACSLLWLWMWHSFVSRAFNSSYFVQGIMFLGAALYYIVLMFHAIQHWHHDEEQK